MKYLDEYRDERIVQALAAQIGRTVTKPWNLMEICGGQTHTIMRYGLDELLPPQVRLVHGPGCPVCVTPLEIVDKAIAIASQPSVTFVSYGDMLRVPDRIAISSVSKPMVATFALCTRPWKP